MNYILDINNYNIWKNKVGSGSSGQIRLVVNKSTKKKYALKIIKISNFNNIEKEIEYIKNEIKIQLLINNEYIIKMKKYLIQEKYIYLLMEYAPNGNLFKFIKQKKNGKINEKLAIKMFFQICQAINILHKKNFIHRDIKPENILLDKNFNIKLCDFGWAAEYKNKTKRKTFCGTYEYIAPEIFDNKKYDTKIDIWSLGVLLYEMLHGVSPFKSDSLIGVIEKIKLGKIKFNKKLNKNTIDLILWLLNKDPKKRPNINNILTCGFWKIFNIKNDFLKPNLLKKKIAKLLNKTLTSQPKVYKINNLSFDKNNLVTKKFN